MRGLLRSSEGSANPRGVSRAASRPSMLVTEVSSHPGTVTTQCGPRAGHRQCAHRAFQLRGKSQGGRTPEGRRWGNLLTDGFVVNGRIPSCFPCASFSALANQNMDSLGNRRGKSWVTLALPVQEQILGQPFGPHDLKDDLVGF